MFNNKEVVVNAITKRNLVSILKKLSKKYDE